MLTCAAHVLRGSRAGSSGTARRGMYSRDCCCCFCCCCCCCLLLLLLLLLLPDCTSPPRKRSIVFDTHTCVSVLALALQVLCPDRDHGCRARAQRGPLRVARRVRDAQAVLGHEHEARRGRRQPPAPAARVGRVDEQPDGGESGGGGGAAAAAACAGWWWCSGHGGGGGGRCMQRRARWWATRRDVSARSAAAAQSSQPFGGRK